VCGTENRDEAQFCRACGTAFAAAKAAAASAADGTAANVCAECGFQNKPAIRYCANCGMSLAAASDASAGAATPSSGEASAGSGPPPISYQSFATVSPYPTSHDTDHSSLFDHQGTPDIPDPDAAIALRQQEGYQSHGDTTLASGNPAPPSRTPLILGMVLALLAVAGIAAWLFMRNSNPAPPVATPAPTSLTPDVAAAPTPAPAPPATAAPIVIEESPRANAALAPASTAPPSATLPPPPTAAVPLGTPPAAAAPLPKLGDPAVESADAEAKRVAAEKRREKAAKDKAERDAKAKAAAEQSVAASQRAEQEAQAKRRAEEAQRARASAAPPPPPPAPVVQARGVREICAGRGTIAEAVCQSRQCGLAEHANEQICRQLRDADERRRNMQN